MGKHRHPSDARHRPADVYTLPTDEYPTAALPVVPGPPGRVRRVAAAGALLGILATGAATLPSSEDSDTSPVPVARTLDRQAVPQPEAIHHLAVLAASRALSDADQARARDVQAAAERTAQAAQEARAKARRDREAAAASQAAHAAPQPPRGPATETAPSGPAAQIAVRTAMAQLGKPYVWGATGPSSFDCSGLVLYAYRAAGISLPRVSSDQARAGVAVSRANIQPGDLVAFYSPVSHIGIYIGNGQVIHAPEPGDVVKISGIDVFGSITAIRRVS